MSLVGANHPHLVAIQLLGPLSTRRENGHLDVTLEVSKRLGSVGYTHNIPHLYVGYNPYTNRLLTRGTSKHVIAHKCPSR